VPDGAFYLFPDISYFFGKGYKDYTIKNADDLTTYLLYEAEVALVSGDAFGNEKCIRISYATSESILEDAIQRVKNALDQLK
jgi:aspartate aminotransferase